DVLYVSGPLGAAALGLQILLGHGPAVAPGIRDALVAAQLDPVPRVPEGRFAARHAGAMIDLSDGLVGDLGHLCRASGCGAELLVEEIPRPFESDAFAAEVFGDPLRPALAGGEDYELLVAVPAGAAGAFEVDAAAHGMRFHRAGRLTPGEGIELVWRDGRRERSAGAAFQHFR